MIRSKQGINNRSLYFALFSLDICLTKNDAALGFLYSYPKFSFLLVNVY